jgi:hypothetical protein
MYIYTHMYTHNQAFAAKHGLGATTRGILEEYISQSVDDILCVLDVAYAEGRVDRIPVHVGDEAGALAAVNKTDESMLAIDYIDGLTQSIPT